VLAERRVLAAVAAVAAALIIRGQRQGPRVLAAYMAVVVQVAAKHPQWQTVPMALKVRL
jgi:hypothetical protein